jgi:hypothetical protein
MRRRALSLSVIVAALAIAACGSSPAKKAPPKPKTVSASVIADAANKAAAEQGYAFNLSATVSASQFKGTASVTGSGSFQADKLEGSLHVDVTPPGSLALVGSIKTEVIVTGGKLYVQVPPGLSQLLPGSKPWLGADLPALPKADGSTLTPSAAFKALAAASTGTALDFGSATVNGESTTHYRETLQASKSESVILDMWIGSDGLPVQIEAHGAAMGATGHLIVTLTGYGTQTVPAAPAASQTGDLASVISQVAGSGL